MIVRLDADGTLDPTFGVGRRPGQIALPPRPENCTRYYVGAGFESVLPGPHGTLYAAGFDLGALMLARLSPDGSLDHDFAGHGLVELNPSSTRACGCFARGYLARDPRGRLLVAGSLEKESGVTHVARFEPDGRLDHTFADRGFARLGTGRRRVPPASRSTDEAGSRSSVRPRPRALTATTHRPASPSSGCGRAGRSTGPSSTTVSSPPASTAAPPSAPTPRSPRVAIFSSPACSTATVAPAPSSAASSSASASRADGCRRRPAPGHDCLFTPTRVGPTVGRCPRQLAEPIRETGGAPGPPSGR